MTHTNDDVLQAARTHLRARRWREAEALAERWLIRQPGNGAACAVRGLVGLASGRADIARDLIETAVSLDPHSAFAYLALAQCYLSESKVDQAEASLRRALTLAPDETEASCLLAGIRMAQADAAGAEDLLRSALTLAPRSALAHQALAELLLSLGQVAEAERVGAAGLALDPECASAWMVHAKVLTAQARWAEACACCDRALLREPENPLFLTELARILLLEGSCSGARRAALTEAESAARQAVTLMPKALAGHLMLGASLRAQGRIAEALALHADNVRMAPQDPIPVLEIALTQRQARDLDAALFAAEHALSLAPDLPQAHLICGDIRLLRGELPAAFTALDRLDALTRPGRPRLAAPLAAAEIAGHEVVLVAPEMLQVVLYARYVPLLAQLGARVSIAADPLAHGLLQRVPGVARLVPLDARESEAIMEPITRLPVLFGTDTSTVPWSGPYCRGDADQVAQLKTLFASRPAWRVGLDLGLAPDPALAAAVAGVLREAGATVVALSPLGAVGQAFEGLTIESSEIADLEQLAMLVQALDGVVTVESLTAHVAGAAAMPCHVLLSLQHDGFWGAAAERTPWYPDMRLYREHHQDGWGPAASALALALSSEPAVASA